MLRCEQCGEELSGVARSCPKCGRWPESALLELLRHADPAMRAQAASNSVFYPSSERIVLGLATALHDPDVEVRRTAGLELFICGPRAEPAVPALIEALDDADIVVQRFAAASLSMVGTPARAALEKLSTLRDTTDEKLRTWVLEAEHRILGF